jgi:hypothetical protein
MLNDPITEIDRVKNGCENTYVRSHLPVPGRPHARNKAGEGRLAGNAQAIRKTAGSFGAPD